MHVLIKCLRAVRMSCPRWCDHGHTLSCGGRKDSVLHTAQLELDLWNCAAESPDPAPYPTSFQALQAWPPSTKSWSASTRLLERSSTKDSPTMRRPPTPIPHNSSVSTCEICPAGAPWTAVWDGLGLCSLGSAFCVTRASSSVSLARLTPVHS